MKPLASLSLDLDNKWSYLKTRGDASWRSLPSYLPLVVPRFLKLFEERRLGVSVFIVGQDAARAESREALASIAAAGHEIGNHSFHHEPWLHLYDEAKLEEELARAEEEIERATGARPRGFRGPGYSVSPATLRVLARRGYAYDASTLPTYLGPLARLYYFFTSSLSAEERERRKALFGRLRDGLMPVKAYDWSLDDGSAMLEIPVTTMPIVKLPFHASYVLYLSQLSSVLALGYFRLALGLCRLTGTSPSLLLHPLDFIGSEDDRDLAFFPAMGMPRERKLALLGRILDAYQGAFEVVPVGRHAAELRRGAALARRDPGELQISG